MFWSNLVILLNGESKTSTGLPKYRVLIQLNNVKSLFCFVLLFCAETDQWTPEKPQTGGSRCASDYMCTIVTSVKRLWKYMGFAVGIRQIVGLCSWQLVCNVWPGGASLTCKSFTWRCFLGQAHRMSNRPYHTLSRTIHGAVMFLLNSLRLLG